MNKNTVISTIKFIIGWPLSLAGLFFIGTIIAPHMSFLISQLHAMDPFFIFLSVVCFLFYFFLRSYFWYTLLRYKGHHIPLQQVTFLWTIAEIQRFIPGNIWSLVSRTTLFAKEGIKKTTIIQSLSIEMQFILLGSIAASLCGANFLFYTFFPNFPYKAAFFYIGVTAILFLFMVVLLSTRLMKKYDRFIPEFLRKTLPHFSFQQHSILLVISFFSFFFFGLGTYFSISALFPLFLPNLFTFIGLFVFSLIIGYLSFITPMGLGVREGVMTVGLSKFIPFTSAGFASLFARIILIFSELLFLGLSFVWYKNKHSFIFRMQVYVQHHIQEILLISSVSIYFCYFAIASWMRYINFYTGRFDLGNMAQTVWNTYHGRIFELTDPNGTIITSRLAFHADFILILLAPLYAAWENPQILLLTQTAIVACGAFFVYAIAHHLLKNKTLSFFFALAFLLNPSVEYTNLYDFHAVTLVTTFLLGAWYFLLKKNYTWIVLFLFLAGITKEQVWLICGFFGLYITCFEKKKILGILLLCSSALLFYFLVWYAIPHNRGGEQHFALSFFADFGSTPTNIVKNILFSPQKTLALLFQHDRMIYLQQLFLPFGYLSIFAPLYLFFALPDGIINILSTSVGFHQIYYQYTAAISPFIVISSIYGVLFVHKKFPRIPLYYYSIYLVFFTLLSAYLYGPLPGAKNPNLGMFTQPLIHRDYIDSLLQRIPEKYSVAATNNIGSHMSHRRKIFTIPVGIDKADIIIFLLNDKYARPSLLGQKNMVIQMKQDRQYTLLAEKDNFILFKRTTIIDLRL